MKTIITAIVLTTLIASTASARERLTVRKHPHAVEYMLSYILCGFHVFSVGPNPKPGQLGSCASWFNYPTHGPV